MARLGLDTLKGLFLGVFRWLSQFSDEKEASLQREKQAGFGLMLGKRVKWLADGGPLVYQPI